MSVSAKRYGLFRLVAAFVLVLCVAAPAAAEEFIRNYVSDITLRADGAVEVIENIEVRAEGDKIRRGIYRDIPTVFENEDGARVRSGLEILGVERDGRPEPWFTESITNGTRIYIGDADVFLSTGFYRYTIRYVMSRQARRFADHDELYWNAIGPFWDFPIASATAVVRLPEGAAISDASVYTGPFGSTQSAAAVSRPAPNMASFTLTGRLNAYEGMTVSVSFQKGVLNELSDADRFIYFLSDYRALILPAIALTLVLLYYFFAWSAVGRDPQKGTIIPLFYPPEGFSPALTHYVWAWGWKGAGWQAFTAALISLAVKGRIEITKSGKSTILKAKRRLNETTLPPGEAVICAFVDAHGEIAINKTTGPKLGSRKIEFTSAIETENRGVFFRHNFGYIVLGVLLSLVCLAVLGFTGAIAIEWLFFGVFGGIMAGVLIGFLRHLMSGTGVFRFFQLAILGFFIVNFVIGSGLSLADFGFLELDISFIAVLSIIAVNILFAVLMRAPTATGRKVMDQIEGFRMYLETAEKERLNFVNEPDMSVARFEKILPYAIALGVEKPWSERFQGELARNAIADAPSDGYHPHWYHGSGFTSSSSLSRDMAGLASGMSAAMIASQPVSSSSSGSSGGGSSGGGGGGGGGGGW